MSISSVLTRLAKSIALLVLLVALGFFALFGLAPTLEFLPGGVDSLAAILIALLLLGWLVTEIRGRAQR